MEQYRYFNYKQYFRIKIMIRSMISALSPVTWAQMDTSLTKHSIINNFNLKAINLVVFA
jgi:hypothetical protein